MIDRFGSRILDVAVRMLLPFIFLFAVYVVSHGHYGPGGGFQGGTICAVGFILLRLVRGYETHAGPSGKTATILACLGLGIYLFMGLLPMFFSHAFLDYGFLPALANGSARAISALIIEIGVAMNITGVFIFIYEALAEGASD